MITVNIKDKQLFNKIYIPYLTDNTRTQIFFGGSSSGKSVFITQRCIVDIMKGGRNYLIIRNTANTLRTSIYNELLKVISDWNLEKLFNWHKTDMTITCINGYQILFRLKRES